MTVLVVYGSKRGGTAGLAEMIGAAFRRHGLAAEVRPAREVDDVDGYDAVVVAGALYMGRWHQDARRFVRRHHKALYDRPVWLVSSGPLDGSAREGEIRPVPQVARLMELVEAAGHATFGGRLAPDAPGLLASRIARKHAGDWRDSEHVDEWVRDVAASLATSALPG